MRSEGELNYAYRLPKSKTQFFAGGTANFQQIDVYNSNPALENNDGHSYFIGGQAGVRF